MRDFIQWGFNFEYMVKGRSKEKISSGTEK
jgi:hypothetical protein